jgi:hypothetical protein
LRKQIRKSKFRNRATPYKQGFANHEQTVESQPTHLYFDWRIIANARFRRCSLLETRIGLLASVESTPPEMRKHNSTIDTDRQPDQLPVLPRGS